MIEFSINGRAMRVDVAPDTPLLWVIRDEVGLTGTKFGCGIGMCGACTVHVGGRATRSCITPVSDVAGAEITTIEGLATDGELHRVQASFRECHGLQCGFCTPGMIMQAVDLLNENPHPSEAEVRQGMEGNLCRCTGYHNIVKAVLAASGQDVASVAAE